MVSKPETTAAYKEAEGRDAFLSGKGLDANPYGFKNGRADWNLGWMSAREVSAIAWGKANKVLRHE